MSEVCDRAVDQIRLLDLSRSFSQLDGWLQFGCRRTGRVAVVEPVR